VPDGTTSIDDVTFWDVRPLVDDRAFGPSRVNKEFVSQWEHLDLAVEQTTTSGTERRLAGYAYGELWSPVFGATRVGGRIRKGTPGGDPDYVDLLDSENQEPGFSLSSAGELYYVWLLFPEDLPRWVRYLDAAVGGVRVPSGTEGIAVVTTIGPYFDNPGVPVSPITLPGVTGLTNTVQRGRCILSSASTPGLAPGAAIVSGGWVYPEYGPSAIAPSGVSNDSIDEYLLNAGVDFPQNARTVIVRVRCTINGSSGNVFSYGTKITVQETLGGTLIAQASQKGLITVQTQGLLGSAGAIEFEAAIPRFAPWANEAASPSDDIFFTVTWALGGTYSSKTTPQLDVIGWEII
jgi:hypothetical protein